MAIGAGAITLVATFAARDDVAEQPVVTQRA
jgi:hypothetical protein